MKVKVIRGERAGGYVIVEGRDHLHSSILKDGTLQRKHRLKFHKNKIWIGRKEKVILREIIQI